MPTLHTRHSRRARYALPLLLWLALTCFYTAFSPGTIEGQGYNKENLDAATALADNLINPVRGKPRPPLTWTRHGGLEVLLELPLVLAARLLSTAPKWPGRLLVLLPILCTGLLATILFVWASQLAGSRRVGFWLALIAAVSTMLWPYAYIGLETSQSLFLLLAAWLVFSRASTHRWSELILLSMSCAAAVSVKSTGVFLLPAVVYLLLAYFYRARRAFGRNQLWPRALCATALVGALFGLNQYLIASFWRQNYGGAGANFRALLVESGFTWAFHCAVFFLSVNKSLFLFAPLLLPCLLALPAAWRAQPGLTIFALLVLLGLVSGFALVRVWTEETWGPRYLHSAIAPLTLCLAATIRARSVDGARQQLPRTLKAWLWATAVAGFAISLLGSFFYYGELFAAANRARQNTLEALQYEPAWNHVRFNAVLLGIWARQQRGHVAPVFWPPERQWWFARPADVAPAAQTEINDLAEPAPLLVRPWRPSVSLSQRAYQFARIGAAALLLISLLLLAQLDRLCRAADQNAAGTA